MASPLPLSRGDETHKTHNIGERQFCSLSHLAGSLLQFKDSLIFERVYISDVCVSVCMRAASREVEKLEDDLQCWTSGSTSPLCASGGLASEHLGILPPLSLTSR